MSARNSAAHTPVTVSPSQIAFPAPPATAATAQRPALLEARPATSEDVFQRILRKLQREENFNTMAAAKSAQNSTASAPTGLAATMLKNSSNADASALATGKIGASSQLSSSERRKIDEEIAEEERYGNDPSPSTLRVVIDTVRTSVSSKLQLATVASVKESMRLIFESRTLLDKLLKDIPLHGNLVDTAGRVKAAGGPLVSGGGLSGSGGKYGAKAGTASTTVQMKELFQEFKQNPVVLPIAKYTVDEATGKVFPQISQRALPATLPARSGSPDDLISSTHLDGGAITTPSASDSRLMTAKAGHRVPGPHPPPHNKGGGTVATARGVDPGPRVTTTDLQIFVNQLRKQIKTSDAACQSEITMNPRAINPEPNQYKEVTSEEYQYQVKRVARLEVLNLEYEGIIGRLHAQLDTVRGALVRRSEAVKDLKTTLLQECTLLRSQLNQAAIRHTAARDGTVDTSIGTDYTSLHSLIDLVLKAVRTDRVIGPDGVLVPSKDEELQRLKIKADEQHAKLKKQTQETRTKCNLIIQRKTRELRSLRLANDVTKLRGVILEQIGTMKADLTSMKQDVRTMMSNAKNTIFEMAQELEYGTRRFAVEVSNFKTVRQSHRAIQDALGAMDELLSPVMKPEFATGSHPWPFARHPEPITFFVSQTHPPEVIEAVRPELALLQRHFLQLQRFSLAMLQQPDMHRPQFGRPLVTLAYRLLGSSQLSIDLLGPIRNAVERDRYLAAQRAKCNINLKYYSFRKQHVEDIAAQALRDFGHDLSVTKIPSGPALRRAQKGIEAAKVKKTEVTEMRMQNAKALYSLWRSSGIDIWGGRRAPVTRDPEDTWVPAPPMSKARRAVRLQQQGKRPQMGHTSAVEVNKTLQQYMESADAFDPPPPPSP